MRKASNSGDNYVDNADLARHRDAKPSRRGPKPGQYIATERTRERIKVGQVIDRLQKHVEGLIEMSPTQIAAARILLDKTLPNLAQVEHKGDVQTEYVLAAPAGVKDINEWLEKYKDLQDSPTPAVN